MAAAGTRSDMIEQTILGIHAVRSALKYDPGLLLDVWMERGRHDRRMERLREEMRRAGIRVQAVPRRELDTLAEHGVHQGVVARVKGTPPKDLDDLEAMLDDCGAVPFLLVLDQIQDPHNLGACLRSADAAGVQGVIAPRDRAVGLTPVVHKVASGASTTVPFFQVTNLARTLKRLRQRGIFLAGATGDAETSLYARDLSGPLAVVMGAEGSGLRRLTRESCDFLLRIPMAGTVGSLNVSVATGIVLFEALRQRMSHGP